MYYVFDLSIIVIIIKVLLYKTYSLLPQNYKVH